MRPSPNRARRVVTCRTLDTNRWHSSRAIRRAAASLHTPLRLDGCADSRSETVVSYENHVDLLSWEDRLTQTRSR